MVFVMDYLYIRVYAVRGEDNGLRINITQTLPNHKRCLSNCLGKTVLKHKKNVFYVYVYAYYFTSLLDL